MHTKHLGPPYSRCRYEKDHALTYLQNYTKGQCRYECLVKDVLATCKCLPGYMNINGKSKPCSLSDHAQCVAPKIKLFNFEHCRCFQACSERLPSGQLIQYGNYKDPKYIIQRSHKPLETMSAAVLYLPDESEITHQEIPDYSE